MSVLLFCLLLHGAGQSQEVGKAVAAAFKRFEGDAQLRGGIASLYVIDAQSGITVFEKDGLTGLAPASTQKVITSVSAYALLGRDFIYQTRFGYTGGEESAAALVIQPSGDPTLGSWRWNRTAEDKVLERVIAALKKAGIRSYSNIVVDEHGWDAEAIPDGWIWQDIGNYYGAGAGGLNWRENQYDLVLSSGGSVGSAVTIRNTKPKLHGVHLTSKAEAGAKGSGDNAYIYFVPGTDTVLVRGTIPASEERFVISGAFPSPKRQLAATLQAGLAGEGILRNAGGNRAGGGIRLLHTESSPPLDSIIYWFNRKSINLYGEALVKTIGYKSKGAGETEEGLRTMKDFWKTKALEGWELGMVDGSGLSPLNRVTTHAMVKVLQYARSQPWFAPFYHSLPEYNGMKLKSGTIRGVKAFCGFHKGGNGKEYIIAFVVNNYNGPSSGLVQKMYKVLDVLK